MLAGDIASQKDGAKKLGETIAPSLGLYGYIAMIFGTLVCPVLKLFGIKSKALDAVVPSAFVSQQAIYIPKLATPLLNRAREIEEGLSKPNIRKHYTDEEIKELKVLGSNLKTSFYTCVTSLVLNSTNMFLKFFNYENPIVKRVLGIIDEISFDVVSKFFSRRRNEIGVDFRLTNKEFYKVE